MFKLKRPRNRYILFAVALVTILQLYALKELDYSTSTISWAAVDEAMVPPDSNAEFQIRDFSWDVREARTSQELRVFREFYSRNCTGTKGLTAASCLSKELIEKIPFGVPSSEIFDEKYDAAGKFKDHLEGEPGHCVTFSTATANALVSAGIPARFIQIYFADGSGHNVVEVWDDQLGWVYFDPLNNGILVSDGKPLSAIKVIESSKRGIPLNLVGALGTTVDENRVENYKNRPMRFKPFVLYPEPWLYLRTGDKESSIFRGSFIAVGDKDFRIGTVQKLLGVSILITAGIWLLLFVRFLVLWLRHQLDLRARSSSEVHATLS